ncbi:MAG: DUF362 domain-containing protein [Acidobacteriota bacterium]|nr:DUF362 domain-containing protein [Acidobacteriota bacterium]
MPLGNPAPNWVYFDEVEQVDVEVPLRKLIRKIAVPKPLLEANLVIACPNLKTHFLDPITGAIKRWVGTAPQDTMHRLHRDMVQETVADLLIVTRPDPAVMDAIVAGDGNGPIAMRGRSQTIARQHPNYPTYVVAPSGLSQLSGNTTVLVAATGKLLRSIGIEGSRNIDLGY